MAEDQREFHRLNASAAGFLAGIMFAAMAVLIRFFEDAEHGEYLVALTALGSALFTLVAFGSIRLASSGGGTERFARYVVVLGEIAMWLFLAILPWMVYQVSFWGSVAVAAVEVVAVALYRKLWGYPRG